MHSFSQLIPLSHSTNCSSSIQEARSWLLLLHTINIWRRKGLDSVDKHCCISSDQQAPSFWKKCLVDSSSSFPVHLSKALASFLIWSTAYGCHPLNVSAGRDMKVVYFVWFQMWSGQLFSCVLISKLRDSWYKKTRNQRRFRWSLPRFPNVPMVLFVCLGTENDKSHQIPTH